jgi:hypothetical protein
LYHEDGSVKGVATNDVGIHKDGSPKVCKDSEFYTRSRKNKFLFTKNTLFYIYRLLSPKYILWPMLCGLGKF